MLGDLVPEEWSPSPRMRVGSLCPHPLSPFILFSVFVVYVY